MDWPRLGAVPRTIERSQEGTRGDLEGFILLAPFRNLTMALGQGKVQLAVGGLRESKQVHLSFPESTPDQPDRLGMEPNRTLLATGKIGRGQE